MSVAQIEDARPRPTSVSWSRVDTYLTCGEKYRLRYVEKAPQQPSGALIGGNAIHEACAEALSSGLWPDGEVDEPHKRFLALFEAGVEEAGGPSAVQWFGKKDSQGRPTEDFWWWKSAAKGMLSRARDVALDDREAGLELLRDGIELELRVQTPRGSRFLSYLDLAHQDRDGRVVVSDYKTGKVGNSPLMQLPFYAWALREARGDECHSARFLYLRGNRQTTVKALEVAPFVPLVERMVGDFEAGLAAGLFPHKPGMLCAYCDVAEFCQYGAALKGKAAAVIGGAMQTENRTAFEPDDGRVEFDPEPEKSARVEFDPDAPREDLAAAFARANPAPSAPPVPIEPEIVNTDSDTGVPAKPEPPQPQSATAAAMYNARTREQAMLANPEAFAKEEFDAKRSDLEIAAQALTVVDSDSYARAGELRTAANLLCTEIKDFFRPLKKSLDDAKQVMLDAEREQLAAPQKVIALLDGRMLAHTARIEEERRQAKAEQVRLEREAAEERRRREEAARALREAGDEKSAAAVEAAPPAPATSNVVHMPETPKAAGMKTSTTYSAKLVDLLLVVKAAAGGDPVALSMLAFDQTAANAHARKVKDAFRVPGVDLVVDRKMSGRAR
ncbi:PD-(D/E)XK nuclease family protein [Candidatus Binatia bacterium]|nr:PD-(D/E)XK nuclease family protein [Candidatus Binatia bacterium]